MGSKQDAELRVMIAIAVGVVGTMACAILIMGVDIFSGMAIVNPALSKEASELYPPNSTIRLRDSESGEVKSATVVDSNVPSRSASQKQLHIFVTFHPDGRVTTPPTTENSTHLKTWGEDEYHLTYDRVDIRYYLVPTIP